MSTLSSREVIAMINEEPLLANDAYTSTVVENDFVVNVNGISRELTPGIFVCLRLAFLEQMRASVILENGRNHHAELAAAMIVHSTDRIVGEDGDVIN
jgi:hypothetical protein